MNKEKEIEEIAKIIANQRGCGCDSQDHCDMSCQIFKCGCIPHEDAEIIYNGGYRKQSEVAKEFFDEIEKLVSANKKTVGCATYEETIFYIEDFIEDLAELKKKYTGEKEDEQVH